MCLRRCERVQLLGILNLGFEAALESSRACFLQLPLFLSLTLETTEKTAKLLRCYSSD